MSNYKETQRFKEEPEKNNERKDSIEDDFDFLWYAPLFVSVNF